MHNNDFLTLHNKFVNFLNTQTAFQTIFPSIRKQKLEVNEEL